MTKPAERPSAVFSLKSLIQDSDRVIKRPESAYDPEFSDFAETWRNSAAFRESFRIAMEHDADVQPLLFEQGAKSFDALRDVTERISARLHAADTALQIAYPKQWEAYEACQLHGKTQAQLAAELNISRPAVAHRLQDARAFLRAYISGINPKSEAPLSLEAVATLTGTTREELVRQLVRSLTPIEIAQALGITPQQLTPLLPTAHPET